MLGELVINVNIRKCYVGRTCDQNVDKKVMLGEFVMTMSTKK